MTYNKCAKCNKITDTRRFNIRYQDFTKTYSRGNWKCDPIEIRRKPYKAMWFYNTKNFNVCKKCIKDIVKLFTKYR